MNDYIFDKKLKSEKSIVPELESVLIDIKNKYNVSDEKFYNLMIAFTEAVTNAIFHGNKQDSEKFVYINIVSNGRDITVSVEDEGNGFDPSKVPDPRDPENLLLENGRGVFLIRTLMNKTDYEFTARGTKVTFQFDLI